MESYFHHWTDAAPQAFTADLAGYAEAVVAAARSTPARRRKRKAPEG
ncbi:hypothetical protein ACFVFS_00345 [Kitasatospora sp. NPDC057692]